MSLRCDLLDTAVSERVLRVLQPAELEVAEEALAQLEHRDEAMSTQWRMRLRKTTGTGSGPERATPGSGAVHVGGPSRRAAGTPRGRTIRCSAAAGGVPGTAPSPRARRSTRASRRGGRRGPARPTSPSCRLSVRNTRGAARSTRLARSLAADQSRRGFLRRAPGEVETGPLAPPDARGREQPAPVLDPRGHRAARRRPRPDARRHRRRLRVPRNRVIARRSPRA